MEIIFMGYIGTTIGIRSFIPSSPKVSVKLKTPSRRWPEYLG